MIKDLTKFNRDLKNIIKWILEEMPHSKKRVLLNALERNFELTSSWILEQGTLTCYKEGWYIKLQGTRCSFSVWADDNDGELVFHRKPNESKLHKLWEYDLHFDESDFFRFSNNNEQEEQEIETSEVKITAHTYVCELPDAIQNQILQECKETFESLAFPVDIEAELDNVKGCKMCDLEDTINVQKYYTK